MCIVQWKVLKSERNESKLKTLELKDLICSYNEMMLIIFTEYSNLWPLGRQYRAISRITTTQNQNAHCDLKPAV